MVSGAFNGSSVYRAYHGSPGAGTSLAPSAPAGAEEQRPLEPGNREVEDQELFQVVAADRPVDEVLRIREERRVGDDRVELGPDIGES